MVKEPFEGTEHEWWNQSAVQCHVALLIFFPLSSVVPWWFSVCLLLLSQNGNQTKWAHRAFSCVWELRDGVWKIHFFGVSLNGYEIIIYIIMTVIKLRKASSLPLSLWSQSKTTFCLNGSFLCWDLRLFLPFCIPPSITSCVFSQQEMSTQQLLVRGECLFSSQLIGEEYTHIWFTVR